MSKLSFNDLRLGLEELTRQCRECRAEPMWAMLIAITEADHGGWHGSTCHRPIIGSMVGENIPRVASELMLDFENSRRLTAQWDDMVCSSSVLHLHARERKYPYGVLTFEFEFGPFRGRKLAGTDDGTGEELQSSTDDRAYCAPTSFQQPCTAINDPHERSDGVRGCYGGTVNRFDR